MNPSRPPSQRRAPRILLWLGSALAVLLVAGLLLADRSMRGEYEPTLTRIRQDVTENVDFFCEQQGVLAADPWFHEPRTEGDAGPLLNDWMAWELERELPKDSPLFIPAHLPQQSWQFKDWLTSPVDVSILDFGWMKQLHAYDRWDIFQNTPVPQPERINWATASIPIMVPTLQWAKFRLMHGLRTGQPLEAARDVRHLAWLMYRSDTTIGAMMAAGILQLEREAHDSMRAPPPEWPPMSHEQVERMRALLLSGHLFSHIAAPVEVSRKARRCDEPAVSRCIAMTEATFLAKYLQPFARDDYREAYTAFQEDLAAFPCGTSLARTVWERGVTIDDAVTNHDLAEQPGWLRRLPHAYFAPIITGRVIAAADPSLKHLRAFREKLASGGFEVKR